MTEGFAAGTAQVRHAGQGNAPAGSSHEGPPSVDGGFSHDDVDIERELPWVADLPEDDRRLFAEEMAKLLAEAAQTDDFADVQQTLREWRATAEICADPVLARRLSGPRVANGPRVPRPDV